MAVPDWVCSSIFYQIFPDRFKNGEKGNDPPNVIPWLSTPSLSGFHGGDLAGIIQRMDYLIDLGVNALYLNPIFFSSSTHRYNTSDYYRIDPKLGSNLEFLQFLKIAHEMNIRVVLDGVFNHSGRGFFAFNDVMENQEDSAYKDWYHIKRFPIEAYEPGDATTYEGWWRFKSLPKFNTENPAVRKYIMDVARYWVEQGIDGWRLDVPNEIDDDNFWEEFRHTVKSVNPDVYLLGEIWVGDRRWVGDANFDGLMNYPARTLILDLLSHRISSEQFTDQVNRLLLQYPPENLRSMYNLLGSHDTERLLTHLGGDLQKVRLGYLFLMCLPGAPAVYYGDEIGLTGGIDPDCRKPFPWEEEHWNRELREWIKGLIKIRKENRVFSDERFHFSVPDLNSGIIQLSRGVHDEEYLIVFNPNDRYRQTSIPTEREGVFIDLITNQSYLVQNLTIPITIEAWSGVILRRIHG